MKSDRFPETIRTLPFDREKTVYPTELRPPETGGLQVQNMEQVPQECGACSFQKWAKTALPAYPGSSE